MGSSCSLLFSVFTLILSALFLASSSVDNTPAVTITIPLTSTFPNKPPTEPWVVFLRHLASESLARTHRLKHGKTSPHIKTSLFPHSYGGHTIPLSFGTPPQKLSYLVDTGSHVVWAPCTTQYKCINCSFPVDDPNYKVLIFDPELSSSSKVFQCRDPRCLVGCPRCNPNSKNCSVGCPYTLQYAGGEESGFFLFEKLKFPGKTTHDFILGCTTLAAREPSPDALAGFGRSDLSLPMQMGVKKFAYCLNSHDYDDTRKSGMLIFDYRDDQTRGLSYTPFLNNPPSYPLYYYLGVEHVMMGKKRLRIPSQHLAPSSHGSGGVIIDSGFGYGYMAGPVFKVVADELKKRMSKYRRSPETEKESHHGPCYDFTGHKSIKIPDLIYHFTGGVKMVVPGKNYFQFNHDQSLGCFGILTDEGGDTLEFTPGPSVILGNSQHVDHYVEFDLVNERLGFRLQTC